MNYAQFSDNSANVKIEYQDSYNLKDRVTVGNNIVASVDVNGIVLKNTLNNTEISTENHVKTELSSFEGDSFIKDDIVKIENENRANVDVKVEVNIKHLLFCEQCNAEYQDYCIKCGMLRYILNKNVSSKAYNEAREEILSGILEFRELFEGYGIFALKVIPPGVKFGPFNGLHNSEKFWKIKAGRFLVNDDDSKFLNWMKYINPARSVSERNLFVLQHEDNIYYRSSREIKEGEELLVYFGEEYEANMYNDVEMTFVPTTENNLENVYACTFCCLGFSNEFYLGKHKTVCPNEINGIFPIKEFTQCLSCKIFLEEKEYLEYHIADCYKAKTRYCGPLTQKDKKGRPPEIEFIHLLDQGKELKHSKPKPSSKEHARRKKVKGATYYCTECDFKTKYNSNLQNHIKRKHLKEFDYECKECDYRTYYKSRFKEHMSAKHLGEAIHVCPNCQYKTKFKSRLSNHIRKKHLKETYYKCVDCEFETNYKTSLNMHVKAKHLNETNFNCMKCEYKTIYRSNFLKHMQRKHLKKGDYECRKCEYKTNNASYLETHMKARHIMEVIYQCADCTYKTNERRYLKVHINNKHLKENSYKCEHCHYQTNYKANLKGHISRKHIWEGGVGHSKTENEKTDL